MQWQIRLTGLLIVGGSFFQGCGHAGRPATPATPAVDTIVAAQRGRIPADAMDAAFDYFRTHPSEISNKNCVTIIDFDQPSTARRMHVIDMRSGGVEDLLVAHGKKSGENLATQFSNVPGSNMSSLGIYLTGEQIVSPKHGTAMLLHGKQASNDNALKREIIFHGADYVSEKFIEENGRLGRSLGCPAVENGVVDRLVGQLEGGSVMLIYKSSDTPGTTHAVSRTDLR